MTAALHRLKIEHDGLLYMSSPDTGEDRETHIRRAWFVAKVLATATDVHSSTSTFTIRERENRLREIEDLSRVWSCQQRMGCTYDPRVSEGVRALARRIPDVWGRRKKEE